MINISELMGKRIEQERIRNDWTQEIVANKLGVARSTYANYEAGKREPSLENIKLLADIFDVTTDYLIGHSDIRNLFDKNNIERINLTDDKKVELYKLLEKMNKEQVDHILKTVQFIIKN